MKTVGELLIGISIAILVSIILIAAMYAIRPKPHINTQPVFLESQADSVIPPPGAAYCELMGTIVDIGAYQRKAGAIQSPNDLMTGLEKFSAKDRAFILAWLRYGWDHYEEPAVGATRLAVCYKENHLVPNQPESYSGD